MNESKRESVPDLLARAGEPQSDDPRQWTPPEVVGLALMVAYGVESLAQLGQPGWQDNHELANDFLFNRDLLASWLELFGEEALERLIDEELPDLPLPCEVDRRLSELYLESTDVREHLDREYAQFRDDVGPPRTYRWWWLDAELYGRRIH